ncbi:hypothetical protein DFH06DRAFT_1318145 [Mycena polygramma]|nr:hypothetical protein DFH06DRAFT_1318145 [Mycena polygramma]
MPRTQGQLRMRSCLGMRGYAFWYAPQYVVGCSPGIYLLSVQADAAHGILVTEVLERACRELHSRELGALLESVPSPRLHRDARSDIVPLLQVGHRKYRDVNSLGCV